jgi:hypothetical protein
MRIENTFKQFTALFLYRLNSYGHRHLHAGKIWSKLRNMFEYYVGIQIKCQLRRNVVKL